MEGDPRYDAEIDLNGDGAVTAADFSRFHSMYLAPPGPSGMTELAGWQLGLGITPTVTSCLGDMNYDGTFSGLDVSAARQCVGLPAQGACAHADLDGNAYISANDVIRIGQALGQTCPP